MRSLESISRKVVRVAVVRNRFPAETSFEWLKPFSFYLHAHRMTLKTDLR